MPVLKTMTEAISPTLLINWVFGIGVIEYPIGRPRRIPSALWSIFNFLIYLGFLRLANLSAIVTFQESKIGSNSYRIIACLRAAFIATSICLTHMRAKAIGDALLKLTGINHRMDTLGVSNDYEAFFKSQIIQLGVSFTLMFITMAFHYEYIPAGSSSDYSRLGYLMATNHSLVIAFIIDHTFSSNIRYFRNRFQRLNAILMESDLLGKRDPATAPSADESYSSVMREIHGNNSSSIRAANKQWLLYIIRETRMIHRSLRKTAMEWNTAFGIQVLCSVAISFNALIALLYTFYITAMEQFSNNLILSNWIQKIIFFMWFTHYVVKIIMIVDACESTSCEANRTGELINKLLGTPGCDEDIHDEISIFSLQLLQNPLKFTANGFFRLNYSLVHGMIGSVTTYIVIMIQMRSIYDSDSTNPSLNSTMLIPVNSTN